jgi:hypothetical protein
MDNSPAAAFVRLQHALEFEGAGYRCLWWSTDGRRALKYFQRAAEAGKWPAHESDKEWSQIIHFLRGTDVCTEWIFLGIGPMLRPTRPSSKARIPAAR